MPFTPEDYPEWLYKALGIDHEKPKDDDQLDSWDQGDDWDNDEDQATPNPGQDNNVAQPPSIANTNALEGRFPHKTIEYVRVYLLGKQKGNTILEEFEATTGYHIRTIPAYQRFQNPVDIGAGGGLLATVDRFGAYDLIRVTDQFCNANPAQAFNANGMPVSGYDWSVIQDTAQISLQDAVKALPLGTFSQGIMITPRGRVVILVQGGYIYWDIGKAPVPMQLPAAFADVAWAGIPGASDQRTLEGDYHLVAPIQWHGSTGMILLNVSQGTVDHMVPGPDGNIVGCALTGRTASIFTATDGVNCDMISRFQFIPGSYFACGVESDTFVLPPSQVSLTNSWTNLDYNKSVDPAFLDFVNRGYEVGQPYTKVEQSTKPANRIGRILPASSDSVSMSLGRIGTGSVMTSSINTGKPIQVPVYTIPVPNPNTNNIRKIAFMHNMIVEMCALDPTKAPSSLGPLFRILHGNRYDYLTDGGYVYGCTIPPSGGNPNTTVQAVNDGLQPFAIALDRSNEPGTLITPPDCKLALVDITNGRLLPGDPIKSLGYQIFGGTYAVINPVYQGSNGWNGVAFTACTNQFWNEMQAIDGVGRQYTPGSGVSTPNGCQGVAYGDPSTTYGIPGQFMPGTDIPAQNADEQLIADQQPPLDWPWNTFIPRIVPPSVFYANPNIASWSPGKDPFLNYWLPIDVQQKMPAVANGIYNTMFCPKRDLVNTPTPVFEYSCDSGFFLLNWAQEMLQTPNGPDSYLTTFQIPPPVLATLVGPIDPTPYQDTPTDVETGLGSVPGFLGLGQACGKNLNRAVGFDTNIRSWVAVELTLQYAEQAPPLPEGVAGWVQPAYIENGLGVSVGSAIVDQQDVLFTSGYAGTCSNNYVGPIFPYYSLQYNGAYPGFIYDSGDKASGGANAVWEVDVLANNVPINTIASQVTTTAQITGQAPSGLQSYLEAVFNVGSALGNEVFDTNNPSDLGDSFYESGTVYFSSTRITSITVKARLVNYAFDVYRVGYATINFTHPTYWASGICANLDPGFALSPNCATPCCGNILCTSYIFYGNKLLSTDVVRPVVTNVVWEGEINYALNDDPYADLGLSVGTFFGPNMEFNMLGPVSGWNVNLRTGFNGQPPAL